MVFACPSAPRLVLVLAVAMAVTLPAVVHGDAGRKGRAAGKPEPGGPLFQMERARLEALLVESARKGFIERFERWSRLFLGTPYHLDPLGEGETGSVDKDPLYDLGRVDCQTYVEQVMALSRSSTFGEFERRLKEIRYKDGSIDFRSRHHLMAMGWIPGQVKAGTLRDITRKVGGDKTKIVEKRVDKKEWRGKFQRMYKKLGPAAPEGIARLDYVPLADLHGVSDRLPRIAVAYVVTEAIRGVPYLVSHMGLVLREPDGKVLFRHASANADNRSVIELPLADYVKQLQNSRRRSRRPPVGLAFSEPLAPAPMVSQRP